MSVLCLKCIIHILILIIAIQSVCVTITRSSHDNHTVTPPLYSSRVIQLRHSWNRIHFAEELLCLRLSSNFGSGRKPIEFKDPSSQTGLWELSKLRFSTQTHTTILTIFDSSSLSTCGFPTKLILIFIRIYLTLLFQDIKFSQRGTQDPNKFTNLNQNNCHSVTYFTWQKIFQPSSFVIYFYVLQPVLR